MNSKFLICTTVRAPVEHRVLRLSQYCSPVSRPHSFIIKECALGMHLYFVAFLGVRGASLVYSPYSLDPKWPLFPDAPFSFCSLVPLFLLCRPKCLSFSPLPWPILSGQIPSSHLSLALALSRSLSLNICGWLEPHVSELYH